MEHQGQLMVSVWVNDLELVLGFNDLGEVTREELHRRVGELVVKQGLGIWHEGYRE
jgi:hypothetical protein